MYGYFLDQLQLFVDLRTDEGARPTRILQNRKREHEKPIPIENYKTIVNGDLKDVLKDDIAPYILKNIRAYDYYKMNAEEFRASMRTHIDYFTKKLRTLISTNVGYHDVIKAVIEGKITESTCTNYYTEIIDEHLRLKHKLDDDIDEVKRKKLLKPSN